MASAIPYQRLDLFQPPTAHGAVFQSALGRALDKVANLVPRHGLRNPRISRPGTKKYDYCTPDEWVASFWPGQMWLAFSLTGDQRFLNSCRARRPYFRKVIETPAWHDHDLGFLFSLTAVADYKLTGDLTARDTAIEAARLLAARWRQPLKFVMCWNPQHRDDPDLAARKPGTMNVDSFQGMALLFWAAQETGQASFAEIAHMHMQTGAEYLIRDDFSSFHAYDFDPRTGAPVGGFTHQGHSDDSCWSRGQSWCVHGFAQSYLATGVTAYRDIAAKLADYVAERVPADGVPLWDYDLPAGAPQWRDSSAGAVTAAGLYALAQGFGPGPEGERYTALADRMLLGLVQNCDLCGEPESDGLLGDGAAFIGLGLMDQLLPYGDYYYLEALMRAVGHTEFFW